MYSLQHLTTGLRLKNGVHALWFQIRQNVSTDQRHINVNIIVYQWLIPPKMTSNWFNLYRLIIKVINSSTGSLILWYSLWTILNNRINLHKFKLFLFNPKRMKKSRTYSFVKMLVKNKPHYGCCLFKSRETPVPPPFILDSYVDGW